MALGPQPEAQAACALHVEPALGSTGTRPKVSILLYISHVGVDLTLGSGYKQELRAPVLVDRTVDCTVGTRSASRMSLASMCPEPSPSLGSTHWQGELGPGVRILGLGLVGFRVHRGTFATVRGRQRKTSA